MNDKIIYRTVVELPAPWDDLLPDDTSLPKFTIFSPSEIKVDFPSGVIDRENWSEEQEGWRNLFTVHPEVTKEAAKFLIAVSLDVDVSRVEIRAVE